MAVTTTNLGVITAYGDAVAAGYTGTKAEWQALMASYATVGQQAVDAKNDAVAAKDTAVTKATEATTAANTATTKASEASASAQSIAQSAAQIQENTDDIDQLKSELTAFPANLAPAYSNAATYNVGDLCTYQGTLYSCSTQISTAEDWTAAHWTAVNVSDEISELKSELPSSMYNPNAIKPSDFTLNGLIDANGVYTEDSVATHLCTDYIALPQNVKYIIECENSGVSVFPRRFCVYDENKNFVRRVATSASNMFVQLTGTERYVRVNVNYDTSYAFYCYPVYIGKNNVPEIKSDVIIPQISHVVSGRTIRHRKGIISFTLDGDYDLNASFINLFEKYGLMLGLAIGYNEIGNSNSLETYLDWCNNRGHEMIAYGVTPLPESASYTLAQASTIIRQAKDNLAAMGFSTHGFVGANGVVADRYIPSVKDVYEYGATKANHSGTQESCLFFSSDDPCEAWRYSMQISTLEQMESAVDRCQSEKGLLQFYTHAESGNIQNSTLENVEELILYALNKNIEILVPHKAFNDYYSIRREDVI